MKPFENKSEARKWCKKHGEGRFVNVWVSNPSKSRLDSYCFIEYQDNVNYSGLTRYIA